MSVSTRMVYLVPTGDSLLEGDGGGRGGGGGKTLFGFVKCRLV